MHYKHLLFTINKIVYCVLSGYVHGYMFRQLGCHLQDIKLHNNMITIVSLLWNEFASSKYPLLYTAQRNVQSNKVYGRI